MRGVRQEQLSSSARPSLGTPRFDWNIRSIDRLTGSGLSRIRWSFVRCDFTLTKFRVILYGPLRFFFPTAEELVALLLRAFHPRVPAVRSIHPHHAHCPWSHPQARPHAFTTHRRLQERASAVSDRAAAPTGGGCRRRPYLFERATNTRRPWARARRAVSWVLVVWVIISASPLRGLLGGRSTVD
jgi:hypothetical protein